jgi:hypothetical protein
MSPIPHRPVLFLLLCAAGCNVELGDDWWGSGGEVAALEGTRVRVDVHPGASNDAELVQFLPVGRSRSDAARRVVMRLGPGDLPGLRSGDRLITPAEVQVTTRCDVGQNAPGCDYNPHVAAQLILTGRRDDTRAAGAGSIALSDVQTTTCTKAEHHCRMVFRPAQANNVLRGRLDLPCVRDDSCHVNLVMWSWHPNARSGGRDRLIIGENEGDWERRGEASRGAETDKGRLMVVRERGILPSMRERRRSSGSGGLRIPTNASSVLVYSHRIGRLRAGEQVVVEAKVVTAVEGRARFSTLMFLSRDRNDTNGDRLVRDRTFPSAITEHNGINCTPGTSPCTTHRVAVFRVNRDIDAPVYVNLVARSAVPGGGSTRVVVRRGDGFVRTTRYDADYP